VRKVLANNLKDAIAKLKTHKRDVVHECSLDDAVNASSARLEAWLAANDYSPSEIAMLHENQMRLASALEQLSEDRRDGGGAALLSKSVAGRHGVRDGLEPGRFFPCSAYPLRATIQRT
jgi:hypothetical protein